MTEVKEKLQLKGIEAKNFKGMESVNVVFDKDHMQIFGLNGDGKTTLWETLQACCRGVSQTGADKLKGEKFLFIGKHGNAADLRTTWEDVKGGFTIDVTNRITKSGNDISITASDGRTLTKEWLKEFFNFAFMSAKTFLSHTPKEQPGLLGINTSEYDEKIADLKAGYRIINREVKAYGEIESLVKVEPVDVHALYAEEKRIEAHNKEQSDLNADINDEYENIQKAQNRIVGLMKELDKEKAWLSDCIKKRDELPQLTDQLSTANIMEQIDAADETNRQAQAYESNEKHEAERAELVKRLDENKGDQEEQYAKKTEYITSFDFKLRGLSVNDEGALLLDGRYLSTFSTGEQITIVSNLLVSQNPQNKTVWIDDFELLDPPHQKKVVDNLIKKGFRVITSEVGDKKKGDGSILLKDCRVVGDEKKAKVDRRPSLL